MSNTEDELRKVVVKVPVTFAKKHSFKVKDVDYVTYEEENVCLQWHHNNFTNGICNYCGKKQNYDE